MHRVINRVLKFGCLMTTIGLLAAGQAHAGTTGTMSVTANVTGSCSIASTPLGFGTIPISNGQTTTVDATGTVTLTCTPGTGATDLIVTNGSNDSDSEDVNGYNMAMYNGNYYLAYALDVTQGDSHYYVGNSVKPSLDPSPANYTVASGPITGAEVSGGETFNIYGEVAESQTVGAGAYTDTVTFSVTY